MVRLKVRCLSRIGRWGWISIPVWYDWKSRTRIREASPRLISIPVWYDWKCLSALFKGAIVNFNSSMVRLKEGILFAVPDTLVYFNSSMVRLKAIPILQRFQQRTFQFQYGTIERSSRCQTCQTTWDISIPVWYDWKSAGRSKLKRRIIFQFQYGTIERVPVVTDEEREQYFNSSMVRLKVTTSLNSRTASLISIPVWYDWKLFPFSERLLLSNFNSSMVRLKA